MLTELLDQIDRQRAGRGFLTVAEVLRLAGRGNVILDPFSTLISAEATIGTGNLFYPGVVVEARAAGAIAIGDGNIFHARTLLLAEGGSLTIGDGNEFGDGGVSVKTAGATIAIGDGGRYTQGAEINGRNTLGSGSQILGPIAVQRCTLGAGESYRHPDPDLRGAVLKGMGIARGLAVGQGEVINARATFEQARIERQAVYHPKT
jgi:hypothetical protein